MSGETDLKQLLKSLKPELNPGSFVFCTLPHPKELDVRDAVLIFKEREGTTVVLPKEKAEQLKLSYTFEAAWITLTVHSALAAVGLTAAFSKALGDEGISCNVVAAYYHDHIFVATKEAARAMKVLTQLAE